MRLFPETDYDHVVPERNALYSYEGLMRAIGKFPAFCGESNLSYDLDDTCKRELATLFAHFNQETGQHHPGHQSLPEWRQGLWHITEWACTEPQWGVGTSSCDYKTSGDWAADEYPPQADKQYYGRGPF
jgi:chitodextrinase